MKKNSKMADVSRMKMSITKTGTKQSLETVEKRVEKNTDVSTKGYVWHTPIGIFPTSYLAAEALQTTEATIRNRCKSDSVKFASYWREEPEIDFTQELTELFDRLGVEYNDDIIYKIEDLITS